MIISLNNHLADTWWFGLSNRISLADFEELAYIRREQGFTAIQLVVGIPPEVGPENVNAKSPVGFPWKLNGFVNEEYLKFSRKQIQFLNNMGLTVIVYGAWGHQIKWIGSEGIRKWWLKIINYLDDLDVIYCLSGEVNLWVGREKLLLPNKTTDDFYHNKEKKILGWLRNITNRPLNHHLIQNHRELDLERKKLWTDVLETISEKTSKAIIVHPTVEETGFSSVNRPDLLACNTLQTGHNENSKRKIWQLPLLLHSNQPKTGFINLEPWYEGINDRFFTVDQLYAYWVTMLSGAASYCYGAHGIWNIGDGNFLSHWGKQTFKEASDLITPKLLGLSHKLLQLNINWIVRSDIVYNVQNNDLISIKRQLGTKYIQFYPDIIKSNTLPPGDYWDPLIGAFVKSAPEKGPLLIIHV